MEDIYLCQPRSSILGVKSESSSSRQKRILKFTPTSLSSTEINYYYESDSPKNSAFQSNSTNKKSKFTLPSQSPTPSNKTNRKETNKENISKPKTSNFSIENLKYAALAKNNIKKELNVETLTNTEDIKDYCEYTENCIRLILNLPPKGPSPKQVSFPFPKSDTKKKLAVFDIDETLIHCTGPVSNNKSKKSKNIIEVQIPTKQKVKIGINIRPNWKECINLIKDQYNIVTYTASHSSYADAVLNHIDPKRQYFPHRLYRNNCICKDIGDKKLYIKDLDIFADYDLKDVVIIDNSVLAFAYHLNNGIPIMPFYEKEDDDELVVIGHYLRKIYESDDLREINKQEFKLDLFITEARKELHVSSSEDSDSENDLVFEPTGNKEKEKDANKNIINVRRNQFRAKTQFGSAIKNMMNQMHEKMQK